MKKQLVWLSTVVINKGAFQSAPNWVRLPCAGIILTSTPGESLKKLPFFSFTYALIRPGDRYTLHELNLSPPNVNDPVPIERTAFAPD
jgi:hypothetical protein